MTLLEYTLFGFGSISLALFLVSTMAPLFRSRLETTAESASKSLRGEFLYLSRKQILGMLLSTGGILASIAMIATRSIFLAAALGISPALLSGTVVRHFGVRRRKKIVSQLPAFLEILAGHVKAGHSIPESLQEAIPLLPRGIREEVAWMCQTIRLGTSLLDALLLWEKRMSCEEVSLVVRPLRIAIPAGGNLFDLFTRCRDILRAKMRLAEKMRSMTAQARLQAVVLTLLPPGFVAVLSRIEPEYLGRCTETTQGRFLLSIALILQALGWFSIRRIMTVGK